jgi:hypothetical protein
MSDQPELPGTNPILSAIAEALAARIEAPTRCRICGLMDTVQLNPEVINLPASTRPNTVGHNQPCAETICSNCGNTQLYNLWVLGLLDEYGRFNV